MAFIPFSRGIDAFMSFTGPDDEPAGFSLFFQCGVTVGVNQLNDLGAFLASWYDTDLQPLQTAGYTLTRIKLRDMTTQFGPTVDWVGILPLTGSRAGNSMPSSVCWAMKKQTGLAGRAYRGRTYWMGMSEADVSGNYVDSVYATDVLNAWNQMITDAANEGDGYELVVPSRQLNGVARTTGVMTPVLAYVHVDTRVDTMRKRLPDG